MMQEAGNSTLNDEPPLRDAVQPVITRPATPPVQRLAPRPFTRSQALRVETGFRTERDALPSGPGPLSPTSDTVAQQQTAAQAHTSQQPPLRRQGYRTVPDAFGRYRIYISPPVTIPDLDTPMAHWLPVSAHRTSHPFRSVSEIIAPCPNLSVFYILRYHWLKGDTKSLEDRDYLVEEVMLKPGFNPSHLAGVNLRDIDDKLAEAARSWDPNRPPAEGWKNIPLRLEIPRTNAQVNQARCHVEISGYRAQSLLDIMVKVFSSNNISTFQYEPFHELFKPPGSSLPAQPLAGEMYTSPMMINAHREVQLLTIADTTCTLPRCVAAYMFASDGMQFAQFSHVKGWPILVSFGNESKYERCKPSSNTCYAAAHIPTLPDAVKEKIASFHNGKPPSESLLTHLRRELMHAVWSELIDEAFVDAWKNGVVVDCADGVRRRVFPRIMTYSADYPEKVLLAAIRNNGQCLCPRCLVQKSSAGQVGTPSDMNTRKFKRRKDNKKYRDKINQARNLIYNHGRVVQSKAVEDLLKSESYVPTLNAFSKLGELGFSFFSCLVVDELHEVELGVWKSLFKHLIRLLFHGGNKMVAEFNKRFRSVPTFGSTIRKFAEDVADMGRIAARDFEDILQCCLPVFEGLLPESCDDAAQRLLFVFAQWHGLAKLRLHTKSTLTIFKSLTVKMATLLRHFAKLTEEMNIRETPSEYARRKKQSEAAKATSMGKRSRAPSKKNTAQHKSTASTEDGRQIRTLNLDTYKTHALGDYPRMIEDFGTTDSFSTQIGELQNQKFKAQYFRTNRRNIVEQMTRVGDIVDVLQDMTKELNMLQNALASTSQPQPDKEAIDSLLNGQPYSMGLKDRSEDATPITRWVSKKPGDIAVKFFLPQLKRHLLLRILGSHDHPNYNDAELIKIRFDRERMFKHNTLTINYTSYDVLRQQDTLNLSSQCFALLPGPTNLERAPSEHPFIYAKVIGIYHAHIVYDRRPAKRFDFVHVRWLYYDYDRPGGWNHDCLDRLHYHKCSTDQDILDAFDFVDPQDIIRATHLIPDFKSGITDEYLSQVHSISHDHADHMDWKGYYVARFVDRDILMRYVGGGVGHYRQTIGNTAAQVDNTADEEIDEGEDEGHELDGTGIPAPEDMDPAEASADAYPPHIGKNASDCEVDNEDEEDEEEGEGRDEDDESVVEDVFDLEEWDEDVEY
ncbi:hypothetical protein FRC07_003499 [Ceratobasidium sp. 392]|nr:hypothetical protein FRC07_003499 [Ceratobasidium sp. 392]